jgi:hypothetical protein
VRASIVFAFLCSSNTTNFQELVKSLDPLSRSQHNSSKIESSEYRYTSMKQTRYITTTIQAGNRLEIDLPNLPIGQKIEVILIIPDALESNPQTIDRRAFLKLSIEERRQILARQAEAALPYYQENKAEWEEWINLDIAEIYAP